MLKLNSRRTPKPDGRKKKIKDVNENDEAVEEQPYEQRRDKYGAPEFVTDFSSSNLQGVAYDPEKKQMWIRFQDGSVYQYYNVPLNIYRNFWHASSKGKYFWEKIRRNYSIPYRRLTSSLMFIPVENMQLGKYKFIPSKVKLQLRAAKRSFTLYNNSNITIQQFLNVLHDLSCPGFEQLSNVTLNYDMDYVFVYAPTCDLIINPGDVYHITLLIEGEARITFDIDPEDFVLGAANEVFAYLESH